MAETAGTDETSPAGVRGKADPPDTLPAHFKDEWTKGRDLIEKQDERIQETRKLVFGLFSSLLAANGILGGVVHADDMGKLWLGVHISLLGLLLAGRFIEQQSFLLQSAAVSRLWVLELFTPVELTGTICDRFSPKWVWRTTLIYVALGLVSTAAAGFAYDPQWYYRAGVVDPTLVYSALILWVGMQDNKDTTSARQGLDWSFGALTCRVGESVSVLLVNQYDNKAVRPARPAAELRRLFDADGKPVVNEPTPLLPLGLEPTRTRSLGPAKRQMERAALHTRSPEGRGERERIGSAGGCPRRISNLKWRLPRVRRDSGLQPRFAGHWCLPSFSHAPSATRCWVATHYGGSGRSVNPLAPGERISMSRLIRYPSGCCSSQSSAAVSHSHCSLLVRPSERRTMRPACRDVPPASSRKSCALIVMTI